MSLQKTLLYITIKKNEVKNIRLKQGLAVIKINNPNLLKYTYFGLNLLRKTVIHGID